MAQSGAFAIALSGRTSIYDDCPIEPREVLQNTNYGFVVPAGEPLATAGIERAFD